MPGQKYNKNSKKYYFKKMSIWNLYGQLYMCVVSLMMNFCRLYENNMKNRDFERYLEK